MVARDGVALDGGAVANPDTSTPIPTPPPMLLIVVLLSMSADATPSCVFGGLASRYTPIRLAEMLTPLIVVDWAIPTGLSSHTP